MKPEWSNAPAWANFLAMDESGHWYWYKNEPCPVDGHWRADDHGMWAEQSDREWRHTLEGRPERDGRSDR